MTNLISPPAAAAYLTISIKTLEAMRVRGNGPVYVQVAARRVAYRKADLDDYIQQRMYRSTSEYGRGS